MCHTIVPNRYNMLLYYDGRTMYTLRIVSIIYTMVELDSHVNGIAEFTELYL